MHAPTSPKVVDFFIEGKYEVAAGVRQQLEADAKRLPGLRLLPGRFMQIQQAMGVHKDSSSETKAFMLNFVERMKRSGFVLQSMQRHQIQGAAVAALLSPFP